MVGEAKERRNNVYSFKSQEKLISFFSQWLDEPVIANVIQEMKEEFIQRRDSGEEETGLQYLKKCQFVLMEQLGSKIDLP